MNAARRHLSNPLNAIALVVTMLSGAIAVFLRPIGDYGVETDFYGDFVFYSREWMRGQASVMNGFRGPLYYLVLGGASFITRDAFLAGKLISVLSAGVSIRLTGALIQGLWGARAATVACLFVAANATFLAHTYRGGTDLFFWLLFVSTLFFMLRREGRPALNWALAGMLAGAAYLTRYNGLALMVGGIGAALFLAHAGRGRLRSAACFSGTWLVTVAPWALYLWIQTGDPFWNRAFENVAVEVYTTPGNAARGNFIGAVGFQSVADVMRVDPVRFLTTMTGNIPRHLWRDARELIGLPWAAAAAAGLVLALPSWRTRGSLALAWVGLVTFGTLLPVFYNPRFMLPLVLWWGAAAGGLAIVAGSRLPARAGTALLVVLALAAGVAWTREARRAWFDVGGGGLPVEILNLKETLRDGGEPVGPSTPIAARKPHVGYYLGAPTMLLEPGSIDDLRQSGAHYLLVSNVEVTVYPTLEPIWRPLSPAEVPPGLRLAGQGVMEVGDRIRLATLYAIRNPIPYTPQPVAPFRSRSDPDTAVTGVDRLRLRLARWYLANNEPGVDVPRLLDRIDRGFQNEPAVLLVRGDALLESGDPEEARRVYRRAGGRPGATIRLATVAALEGDRDEYHRLTTDFIASLGESRGDDAAWWVDRAWEYTLAKDHVPALALFTMAVSLAPGRPDLLKHLAYNYEELGRHRQAEDMLVRYLQTVPEDTEAGTRLDLLRQRR